MQRQLERAARAARGAHARRPARAPARGVRRLRRPGARQLRRRRSRRDAQARPTHGLAELDEYIAFGASPRGPISLVAGGARARAHPRPRLRRRPRTCSALAKDALRHRLVLSLPGARGGGERRHDPRHACSPPCPCRRSTCRGRARRERRRSSARRTPERPGPGPMPAAAAARARRSRSARRAGGHARRRLPLVACSATAPSSRRSGRTSPATTSGRSTGTSPRARASRTCACSIAERVLVTWLVLDTSPSMQFGTADRRKADVAEGVAIAVGHVATRRGNRLGVVTFGDAQPDDAAAAPGAARADRAARARCATSRSRRRSARRRSARRCARTGALARQRSLVVVVSDFRGPLDWRRPLLELAAGTTWSPSRSATRASRSCRTPASSGSSTPRPAGSCASTRAAASCASASPRPPPRSAAASRACSRALGVPPRRALDLGRLAARRSRSSSERAPRELRLAALRCSRSSRVPVLVGAVRAARAAPRPRRRRASRRRRCCRTSSTARPGARRHLPLALLLVALAAMIVGVARPHATVSVPREEATVVLAIDVSRSMTRDGRAARRGSRGRADRRGRVPRRRCRRSSASASSRFAHARARRAAADRPTASSSHDALDVARTGEGTAIGDAVALAVRARPAAAHADGTIPPTSVLLISDGARDGGRTRAARRGAPGAGAARPRLHRARRHAERRRHAQAHRRLPGADPRAAEPADAAADRAARAAAQFFRAAHDARARARCTSSSRSRLGHKTQSREITDLFAGGAAVLLLAGGALSALWFRRVP